MRTLSTARYGSLLPPCDPRGGGGTRSGGASALCWARAVGWGHRTASPHTAMINASPAGRHRSTVYRGPITLSSFPAGETFGLPYRIGDSGANIKSSQTSAPVEAQPGGAPATATDFTDRMRCSPCYEAPLWRLPHELPRTRPLKRLSSTPCLVNDRLGTRGCSQLGKRALRPLEAEEERVAFRRRNVQNPSLRSHGEKGLRTVGQFEPAHSIAG
jgi:hypothetical protein